MTVATDVIAAARSELGYTECPRDAHGRCLYTGHTGPGQNHTKFAAEAGLPNGVYWCDVGDCALFIRCHTPLPAGVVSASTRASAAAWKRAGQWVPASAIQPGDHLHYCIEGRNGPGQPDHVGIATSALVGGHVHAVECNTSSDDHGSQSNGGGVYEKLRPLSVILGAGRPAWDANPQPQPQPQPEDEDMAHKIWRPVGAGQPNVGGEYVELGDTFVILSATDKQQLANSETGGDQSKLHVQDAEPDLWKRITQDYTKVVT